MAWILQHANAVLVLFGAVVAGCWIYLTGAPEYLASLSRIHLAYIPLLLSLTGACILMRFVRWQYLLRRAGVRIETRPSLRIYLAALVGIATPAYAGEMIRSLLLYRKFGTPVRVATWVLLLERLLDVAALALIGALTATGQWRGVTLAAFFAAAGLVWVAALRLGPKVGVPGTAVADLRRASTAAQALGISLAAWAPAAALVTVAAASFGAAVPLAAGSSVFSSATLLGGLTLMPAGVGWTGSLAIFHLQSLGLALGQSVVVISIVRLASTGAALAAGLVFLVQELRSLRRVASEAAPVHFNEIAGQYQDQFASHIWNHLLERKIGFITASLPKPPSAGLGLDLGCGLGQQCLTMNGKGYRVIGIDASYGLARQARAAGAVVVTGDALQLPVRDAALDFVYTVGVLHHLPGRAAQQAACREIARVLKPGGLLIVHETNPRNPLFRFYMGYLFPLLKTIDTGIEWWLEPEFWGALPRLRLMNLEYFTFLPDFIPAVLLPGFRAVEQRLEGSFLKPYAVHYAAILCKTA